MFPVVRFSAGNGKEITFTEETAWILQPGVGDVVEVRYDPGNPMDAVVNSPVNLYFVPGLMLAIGAAFAFAPLPFWLRCLRGAK